MGRGLWAPDLLRELNGPVLAVGWRDRAGEVPSVSGGASGYSPSLALQPYGLCAQLSSPVPLLWGWDAARLGHGDVMLYCYSGSGLR